VIKELGAVSDSNFTDTQLNSGASNFGMTIEEFSGLNPNTQNIFINNADFAKTFRDDLSSYSMGDLDKEELITTIDSTSALPQEVKNELTNMVNNTTVQEKAGWWDKTKDFFGL
jgi:hypothetical protein